MVSQVSDLGTRRANGFEAADASKREAVECNSKGEINGRKPPSRKRLAEGRAMGTSSEFGAPKKQKLDSLSGVDSTDTMASNDANGNGAHAGASLLTIGEVRPILEGKEIVQALPSAASSADNTRKAGQKKISSWDAFKKAALKLKDAGHKSVKLEIDPKTPLSKFFPLLPRSVFESVPFKNCALEYRFQDEGDKLAGASLVAEIELKGPLQELLQIFSIVLGQREPVLRVAAFLGVVLDADTEIGIDSLTLVGCFLGCNVQYPSDSRLIRITSLGATISITKSGEPALLDVGKASVLPIVIAEEVASSLALQEINVQATVEALSATLERESEKATDDLASIETTIIDNEEEADDSTKDEEEDDEAEKEGVDAGDNEEGVSNHINYSIFGTVELPVPGQALALTLDLDLSVIKGMLLLTMSPKGASKAWDNVFGFDNIDLTDVLFKVGYPLMANPEENGKDRAESPADEMETDEVERAGSVDGKAANQARPTAARVKDEEDAKKEKEFTDLLGCLEVDKAEEKDTQPFVALQAGWESPIGAVIICGKISQDFTSSTIKGTLTDVTFAKIKNLYEKLHNVSLGDTDIEIEAKTLTVEVSKEGVRLEGDLTAYGKKVTAKLLLSTEGLSLSATTPKWEVDKEKVLTIENAEISFFVGCVGKGTGDTSTASKAVKKSVGWSGGFSVKGTFTYRSTLKISVSLQIVHRAGGWGYIVVGQAESDLSLSDLVDYCPKHGNLDFSMKKVWLVASNIDVDPTMLPPDAQNFPVKKGIFLCTYLETVPLIDGDSKLVKKGDPNDVAYLYVGLQSSGLPSVVINLPKTMSVDLGSRVKVGNFFCRLSMGTTGPRVEFIGNVVITMEEARKLDFELMLAGDSVGGDLSIVMDGIIENPFGLSSRIALGATGDGHKLGIQVGVIWAQLASTGLPSALGLSGTLFLDRGSPKAKTYGMTVNLSENPMDFIIIINATSLSYEDLVDIASALTSTSIPPGDVKGATFRNLEVYASLGGSFGSQTYPPGLRMRGIMSINNIDAPFACDISISGLKLLACVPSFEVGCLKLTGEKDLPEVKDWPLAMQQITTEKMSKQDPNTAALVASQHIQGKYAILDLQIALTKQYFMLNGKIEIFGLSVYADIECQYKPEPKFTVDFLLQWNDLLKIQLHAKMLNSNNIDRPRDADFEIYALFEQTIVRQIIETLTSVLTTTSDTLSKGVGSVKAEVEALEKKKRQLLESAIQALEVAESDLAREKEGIDRRIYDNQQQTRDRGQGLERERATIQARRQQRKREAEEKREKDKQEATELKNKRKAAEDARVADIALRQREKEAQKAQQERNMISEFGAIVFDVILREKENVMAVARATRDYWDRQVDEINGFYHPMDESNARASLVAAEVLLKAAETAFLLLERNGPSDKFRNARSWLDTLVDEVDTLVDQVKTGYRAAENFANNLSEELNSTIQDIDNTCDEMISEVQADLENVSAEINTFVAEQTAALASLNLELEKLYNGGKAIAARKAKELAEAAKNDDTLLVAARKSLDSVDKLQRGAFDSLNSLIQDAIGDLVIVEHASLKGVIVADEKKQKPFVVVVKGRFGGTQGKTFEFELEWMPWRPGADDMALFKRLTGMVMAFLNGEALGLNKLKQE